MTLNDQMLEVLRQLSIRAPDVITRPGHYTPGKQAHIWAKFHTEVANFVRDEKLQQIHVATERQAATEATGLIWWNPAGGWPLPHFHLGDNIYPANDAQWQRFSSGVIAKVGAQLQSSKAKVSFDQLVQITEGAAQL